MNRSHSSSSNDTAEPPTRAQPSPSGQPTVPESLTRLRNAFSGDSGGGGTADVASRPALPYDFGAAPSISTDATRLQASPIDLDRRGTAGLYPAAPPLYSFQSAATATTATAAREEAVEHTPLAPTTTTTTEAGGASGAREYFHVSPLSPSSNQNTNNNKNSNTNTSNNNSSSSGAGGESRLLFPQQQQQQDITHHAISASSGSDVGVPPPPPPNPLSIPPPPTPQNNRTDDEPAQHSSSNSSEGSSDLSPPRSPGRPLTAEEEQLARIRAYNEMAGTDGSGTRGTDNKRSFLGDTFETLLPNGVTRWFSKSADVVAEQSSGAVPDGVKHAATVAANTIGSGAQHIGDAIEHVPGMVVNAIPSAIMSNEVKQLLFTDFSNTFRSFFHTNILSMPFIIRQAGLVGGIFLLTFVAITSEYATEAYFGAKNQMKNAHKVVVYGDVPKMVWGRWYPMINIFYGITHLIGFIAFSASNSVVLLGAMGMTGGGARALGLIIPSLIALPLVLMKNAHSQEPLAIMSNLLVSTAVVLMFVDFPYAPTPPIKLWPSSATEFFVAMGVSVYAFTGIGSAIPVERVMPARRYRALLRASVAIAYAILMAFGLSGFLSYGNHTCSVMTVSLQKGPLRTAVSALLFFASIMIIPQQTFPLCELSDRRLLGITRLTTYWDLKPNILRIMYLIVSAFAAFIVPYYGLLLSISGALGCGIVGLVVPAALDYVRRERKGLHHNRTMRFWEYIIVFGLGFYGCVVVVIGVLSGSYQLWISIQTQSTDTC